MIYARQSTAIIVTVGPVLDADGVAVTGGVVGDFKISKNGGAPAALNGSATLTHRHTGFYSLSLTTSDVDTVGTAEITIDDTTNACPMKELQVVEPAVYDAFFADSALGYVANAPVNVAQISGDGGAADNLELAFDDTAGAVPWLGISDQGTAQSATATTVVLRAAAAFADNTLIGSIIAVLGSTQGYWQFREITNNTLSDDTVTVDTWTVTPSGTITYKIFGCPPPLSTPAAVNVTQLAGDSQSLTDLKDFADAGYDPSTNKVQGVVLVDTVTTLTNLPAITANWLTAAGLAADAVAEIQSGLATAAALATVDGIVDDILVDTAEIGAAGAGLTNINLPNQTMDIVGNITGNLSGSVGSVTTVNDKTGYALSATGLNLVVPADPSAIPVLGTSNIVVWMGYQAAWMVNEVNVTSSNAILKTSGGGTLATHALSDDGTVFQSEEPS
jgi:hypothetical protein